MLHAVRTTVLTLGTVTNSRHLPQQLSAGGGNYCPGCKQLRVLNFGFYLVNTSGPTNISVSVTDAACGQDNGSITFGAVTSGVPHLYPILYDGGAFASTFLPRVQLPSGMQTTVRGGGGGNQQHFWTNYSVSVTDATCGQDNGSITLGTVSRIPILSMAEHLPQQLST